MQLSSFEGHLYMNFPYLMIASSLIPLYKTVHMLVSEKASKVRESLRMVGMSESVYWLSWLAYYTWANTFVSTGLWLGLMTLVFERSNALITWLFIWTYGQSLFGVVMIAQSIYQRPQLAGIITSVVYLGICLLERLFSGGPGTVSDFTQGVLSLIFTQLSMQRTCRVFAFLETRTMGVNFDTWLVE